MTDTFDLLEGLDFEIPDAADGSGGSAKADEHAEFFGPYQLIHKVGVGGVAKVSRARHIHPRYADTTFAIKILHDELSKDEKIVDLFRKEAYVLSLLKHPNIVRTFEAGVQDEKLFIAMEYIAGRDLEVLLYRCKKAQVWPPLGILLHIVSEVLRALSFAHELKDGNGGALGLVHRDVNPANVFLSYSGRVKLGDFGVSALAGAEVEKKRELAGKVGYFAPEQLLGKPVDQRADVFAAGALMFEMLCHQRLFDGDDAQQIMRLNKKAKIPRPRKLNSEISAELEDVLVTALERRPEDRFQSCREMLTALQPHLPDPVGMPLAVASLIRKMFLQEHVNELQLQEGFGGGQVGGQGRQIWISSTDERACGAFGELLAARGYTTEVLKEFNALENALYAGGHPELLLMDVDSRDFSVQEFARIKNGVEIDFPVVAVSEELSSSAAQRAHAIGAVDLLFKPHNIERVLNGIRAALVPKAPEIKDTSDPFDHTSRRVLLISNNHNLVARLSQGLMNHGFELDVSPDVEEAFVRTDHASYACVMYDVFPYTSQVRDFNAKFRARSGMGLVPTIFLAGDDAHHLYDNAREERSAVRGRNEAISVLADTINSLRLDNRMGRTFRRYAASIQVELRVGGRVFQASSVDVSRGGMMVRCQQMSPVGARVSVSFRTPTCPHPLEAHGRVARVEMPENGGEHGIGIEFERFAANDETELITFLKTIDDGDGKDRPMMPYSTSMYQAN